MGDRLESAVALVLVQQVAYHRQQRRCAPQELGAFVRKRIECHRLNKPNRRSEMNIPDAWPSSTINGGIARSRGNYIKSERKFQLARLWWSAI